MHVRNIRHGVVGTAGAVLLALGVAGQPTQATPREQGSASAPEGDIEKGKDFLVPLTNVCKESKSSQRLNCVESATCERQQ